MAIPRSDPIPYADSVEVIPSDEADDIRLAVQTLEKVTDTHTTIRSAARKAPVLFPNCSLDAHSH